MRRIHTYLGIQSAVAILVSINRLSTWTLGYVSPNEFLRRVDFNNMLVLPLISLAASYLLKKTIEDDARARDSRTHLTVNLIFVAGIYLLGASYGDHEVTNYLHQRFCAAGPADDLCRIVIFHDDEFSHWIFFAGFVMMNAALLFLQALFPLEEPVQGTDIALLIINSLFLGTGILANLGFEAIGLDLYVVAALALLSTYFLWKRGRQPLFVYYTCAYWLGLAGSLIAQGLR